MYWYKKRYLAILGFILLQALHSCKGDSHAGADTGKFFDIKGYFQADSLRLSKLNPLVTKTVVHNTDTETKKLHIENWGNELRLFIESDINKPAWKASYTVQDDSDFLIYKAKDPSLRTRDIIIKKMGGKIKWILIFNHSTNALYESEEKLSYYPDSLYEIRKLQKVKLMGLEKYTITGAFGQ